MFKIHQAVHSVFFSEAAISTIFVLTTPSVHIICNADIYGSAQLTCHYVHKIFAFMHTTKIGTKESFAGSLYPVPFFWLVVKLKSSLLFPLVDGFLMGRDGRP